MSQNFRSFTADAMARLGQQLADGTRLRKEHVQHTAEETAEMLQRFKKMQLSAERARSEAATRDAALRRQRLSEMRLGVHAFAERCSLGRDEITANLRAMSAELTAARAAWHNRPRTP